MNVLEDIRFEKSLPKENRVQILKKVAAFLKEWESTTDRHKISSSYSARPIKGKTTLKEVWKFKVSDGCRILFTRGKHIKNLAPEYEDALVLLLFCKHDDQINEAKRLKKVTMVSEQEKEEQVERIAEDKGREIGYDPEKSITRVFKHISIESLVDLESLQGNFYLNQEQRECINKDYRPLLLFGSGGSGKTTIGIYKIIDLIKQNSSLKIGYFTYSKKLMHSAQAIYETIRKNEVPYLMTAEREHQVLFYDLKGWMQEIGNVTRLVDFDHFDKQFYYTLRQNMAMNPRYKAIILRLSSYDIWREIRGLIKGFAGDNWVPHKEPGIKGIMTLEQYKKLGEYFTCHTQEEKEIIYEIALRYMTYLKEQGLKDENDLCRQILREDLLKGQQYDWIVVDEVQDLTEMEIYLLSQCIKTSGNFLLSGDYHQNIAPTFFDTRRIMTLLEYKQMRCQEDANLITLTQNYRNPRMMVELANYVTSMRQALLGKDKRNDYSKEIGISKKEGTLLTLCRHQEEKDSLLKQAVERAYVYIVVATKEEKEYLQERYHHKIRIFTVYEVKGLENAYIIGVNLISHYKKQWEEILKSYQSAEPLDNKQLYRYLLNMFYVTLSRSQDTLCLVEDEVDTSFIENLFEVGMEHQQKYDPLVFGLEVDSKYEDYLLEARKYEEAEDYVRAIAQYKILERPEAQKRLLYCKGKINEKEGQYELAAKYYYKGNFKREALKMYDKITNGQISIFLERDWQRKYYDCLIEIEPERFYEEVLINFEISIKQTILPHLGVKQKRKMESMLLEKYSTGLKRFEEEIMLSQYYLEEVDLQLQEVVKKLEKRSFHDR